MCLYLHTCAYIFAHVLLALSLAQPIAFTFETTVFSPLQDFLGAAQDHVDSANPTSSITQSPTPNNQAPPLSNHTTPTLSMEEYFTAPRNPKDYDS